MLIAYTRAVSPRLADCELTHLQREPLDANRAVIEHETYEERLRELGATVRRLPPAPELPDATFVEDTAVILDEVAVITRPGAPSRRPETQSVETVLAGHRPLVHIASPGTMDGGDVLVAGRRIYVGLSSRTNHDAVTQLARALQRFAYEVIPVEFGGCLHLKTGVTRIGDELLLLNPAWVDAAAFEGYRALHVAPAEPYAANALRIGDAVIFPAHCPATRARLEAEGVRVALVPLVEIAKAEAGVTCCSLLIDVP